MASTNKHELNHLPVASEMANQRQQQQELIKLLAQHFHSQFYQLTNNSSINEIQQQQQQQSNQAQASNPIIQQHQLQNSPLLQQQAANAFQRTGQHYQQSARDEAAAMAAASLMQSGLGFDLSNINIQNASMNLTTNIGSSSLNNVTSSTNTNNNNNHTSRSHQQTKNAGTNLAIATQLESSQPSLMNFVANGSQQNNLTNFYTHNELNLINAFGLNLTNNQLVLSLQQQQSLIQAAAAARQYELSRSLEGEAEFEHERNTQRHMDSIIDDETTNLTEQVSSIHHSNTDTARKQMLKFSINTILGRGSPQSMSNVAAGGAGCAGSGMVGDGFRKELDGTSEQEKQELKCATVNEYESRKGLSKTRKISEERIASQLLIEAVDVECDPLESSSDSSSINATTPNPPTSSSIIFNQKTSLLPSDYQHNNHLHQHQQGSTHPLGSLHGNGGISSAQHHQSLRHHQHQHSSQPMQFLPGSTTFPWTVASRGKPRRGMMRRAVFSDSQRVGLEKRFQLQKYISKPDRKKLAEKLGLRDSQVKIWFQNRRMKWRNSKERELLSAGGSREQTLPTRNNPNPDLSDVGETVKRLTSTNDNDSTTCTLSTTDK